MKEGKITLFRDDDFISAVREYMGDDAANWLYRRLKQLEEAADYTTQKVDTDITSYEASLESNSRAFQEIEEKAAEIMGVLQAPRINRQIISHAVREIGRIINTQI